MRLRDMDPEQVPALLDRLKDGTATDEERKMAVIALAQAELVRGAIGNETWDNTLNVATALGVIQILARKVPCPLHPAGCPTETVH